MNIKKLKEAEGMFFETYPGGFENPEIQKISKKHKMDKLTSFVHESFSGDMFKDIDESSENMIKLVSRSSMVSVFEKPKFRDAVRSMNSDEKTEMVSALHELLHGDEFSGFCQFLDVLDQHKLAKWTVMTVFRCYYYPDTDLLFKPTTVKNVIKVFELEDLVYRPRPNYKFFVKYRDCINTMKKEVSLKLSPNNAAFSGFLMMAMEFIK